MVTSSFRPFPVDGLYKVLGPGMRSCHGGTGRWVVGRRRSVRGPLVPCVHGIHLCRARDIPQWLNKSLWLVRASKERIRAYDAVVVRWAVLMRRIPLNQQFLRLFAADCAEHVQQHNADPRIAAAILAARRYAFGLIGSKDLAAAESAAWDAIVTTQAAEGPIAWTAGAAIRTAAESATRAAIGSATRAAIGSAAERRWQGKRLFQYINREVDLVALKRSVQ